MKILVSLFFAFFYFVLISQGEESKLVNLSTRVKMYGDPTIVGFAITGTEPKTVLIRLAGPALNPYGVNGNSDPTMTIFRGSQAIGVNDNWQTSPEILAAVESTGAFPFEIGSKDAAVLMTVNPGSLTVHANSNVPGGESIVEIYEVPNPAPSAPTDLLVTSAMGFAIRLEWTASPEVDVNEYGVFRSVTSNSATAEKIAEVSSPTFLDSVPALGVRYYYWVRAYTEDEYVSPFSNPASSVSGSGS